ncbi:hypothetical protein [Helcococcus sueciensis]|uniref:hypothetical protein n=1 Tax=Helcococcus sueciensis TaxID=241555 RepID=UPI00040EBE3B|nr:hypothetical protein [Helcococcus sueciensis]
MQEKKTNFEDSLEYQFLYNDDADSIFLLLSWLENRYIGEGLVPKYTVTKALLTGLRRSIRGRKDKRSIVDAVNKLIGDDINRLELAFTIKAYRNAITYDKLIDKLEVLALKKYSPNQLKEMNTLFHNSEDRDILKFKENVKEKLLKSKVLSENEYHTYCFMDKYVKKKFFRVNFYMDKQIVVDYSNSEIMTLEGKNLTIKELQHFYSKAKFYVNRALQEAYFNQFWYSLNDQVLGRYQ